MPNIRAGLPTYFPACLSALNSARLLRKAGVALFVIASAMTHVQAQAPNDSGSSTSILSQGQDSSTSPDLLTSDTPNRSVDTRQTNGDFLDRSDRSQNPVLSARAINSFLEQNPDVVVELKELAADRIRQQGGEADANDIPDQALYDQIAGSAGLRASISTFLFARGYQIEDDEAPASQGESLATQRGSLGSIGAANIGSVTGDPRLQGFDGNSSLSNDRFGSAEVGSAGASGLAPTLANRNPRTAANASAYQDAVTRQGTSSILGPPPSSTDAPQVLRRPAPYNLRSMRDLYTQVPDQAAPLKRFGSNFFLARNQRSGSLGSSTASMDVPLGPDYVLGAGDMLTIELWGSATLNLSRTVGRDGRILLADAGSVQVAGLPLGRAQGLIEGALKSQYRDAQVAVTVERLRSVRVYVAGDVQRPGGYDISSLATPLSALYTAGGPTSAGSLRTLQHMRGEKLIESIDLYSFFVHGMRVSNTHFESGDTLLVPPAGAQVALSGAVRRPAIYELKPDAAADGKTLAALVEDAGGLLPSASLDHVTVERIVAGRDRQTLTLDASNPASAPQSSSSRIDKFELHDGDRVHIDPVLPYSDRAVYLEGHVARPGRVAYRDGMRISDLLHSYRDLLPEPAAQGEIVRLVAPDLHAETLAFTVSDVLIGNNDLALQPFDTIRVRSRYETDAPRVTVRGEVLSPGIYPLSEGMTAAQLVRMAGGFKRDALRERADLNSYEFSGSGGVDGQLRSIAIGVAVAGSDASADVLLKAGDILSIHQLTGWENVGQSINIAGQVRYPGVYGFKDGERLSSVLRRAGGLLPNAYPMGAVLLRDQVKELELRSRDELIRQIQANSAAARLSPNLGTQDTGATLQLIQAQQDQLLADLRSHPPAGRLVIHISPEIDTWANTSDDIELRRGDLLTIPKQPGFVLVTGQVYNSTALTFAPDETAGWYLSHAGGANTTADRGEIFIIRANGSVIGRHSSHKLGGDVLSTKLNPGDVVVVPQKIIGRSLFWKNLLATAQLASSIAITAAVATL